MDREGDDPRIEAARNLMDGRGLEGIRLSLAGNRREILALAAPPHLAGELAEIVPQLKALGFHYVALDLAMTEATD
jgi:hypothetical protein